MSRLRSPSGFVTIALLVLGGCADLGNDIVAPEAPPPPPPPGPSPTIAQLVPMRTFPGDTLRVIGEHFGSGTAMDVVLFTTTSRAEAAAEIISWSDTEIVVIIPDNATDGPIRVSLANGDAESAGRLFVVAPEISYDDDVFPLLTTYGCTSCHGGINNLEVFPYAALLRGDSDNGPVVLPRRSADSVIRRKISPQPPFGERMPQGGPYLSEAEQLLIADWIDQGARDN